MTTKKVPEILIKINKFEETELLRQKKTLQASITHIAEEIFDINKRITGEMEKGVNVDLYRYLEASRKKIHKYNGEIANLKEQESLLNKQMQDTFNEGRKMKNLKQNQAKSETGCAASLANKIENGSNNTKDALEKMFSV